MAHPEITDDELKTIILNAFALQVRIKRSDFIELLGYKTNSNNALDRITMLLPIYEDGKFICLLDKNQS